MTDTSDQNHSNMISDLISEIHILNNMNFNDFIIKKQEFIHPLGNLEYKIQSVNLTRDYDLWKFLFSIEVEMNSFSEKDESLYNSILENPVYIKFKNKEDESLFLLSFKGYTS